MKNLRNILPLILVSLAAIILFEYLFPRDVASAQARLADAGYTKVEATKTRRYCGKNRKVFRFDAVNAQGAAVRGELCFDLIRPLSSIKEDTPSVGE